MLKLVNRWQFGENIITDHNRQHREHPVEAGVERTPSLLENRNDLNDVEQYDEGHIKCVENKGPVDPVHPANNYQHCHLNYEREL